MHSLSWIRVAIAATISVLFCGAICLGLWLHDLGVFHLEESRLTRIEQLDIKSNTEVFSRNNKLIAEFFHNYQIYVPFDSVPKRLVQAIIAIEDKNFWTHRGVDPEAILRALWARVQGSKMREQGASTITQQVARNLFLNNEKTIERKVLEMAWALKMESRFKKKRILEIYLNHIFLGQNAVGVAAASKRYFKKDLNQLHLAELATIAGLFQSPSRFNPTKYPVRAIRRQQQVLRAMLRNHFISQKEYQEALRYKLKFSPPEPLYAPTAPYFADFVREEAAKLVADRKSAAIRSKGLKIYTTLDPHVQRMAEDAVRQAAPLLQQVERQNASLEAAILVTHPRTGDILAMVGGRDYQISQFNRTSSSLRSPGSSFKPVVYSLALSKGWKWSDMIYVSPINIENYRPRNAVEDYLTETTVLRAFYRSMNAPTMEIARSLGMKAIVEQGRALGIRSHLKEEFATALGGSDITFFDQARLYGTLANEGRLTELRAITKITTATGELLYEAPPLTARVREVLSPQISFLMVSGMRAVLEYGTGFKSHALSSVAAGKTGTSNQSEDNWFCGFSPNLLAVVWVGTDDHKPIFGNATGAFLALPIWQTFMTRAQQEIGLTPFRIPSGVTFARINPQHGYVQEGGVKASFLEHHAPDVNQTYRWSSTSESAQKHGGWFAH